MGRCTEANMSENGKVGWWGEFGFGWGFLFAFSVHLLCTECDTHSLVLRVREVVICNYMFSGGVGVYGFLEWTSGSMYDR